MNSTDNEKTRLVSRGGENSPWQFWQYCQPLTGEFHLYAFQPELAGVSSSKALHLGAFNDTANLAVQKSRFLEEPKTCVALELDAKEFAAWLENPEANQQPEFVGYFGSPWSGYGIKRVEEHQVEVIYAADRRYEWIGVFTQAEAFAWIELDYDRRRRRCVIC
ncbi:hypothetical protein SAMN05660443_1007 [Marinospirillum celere]|uniref:Uncharacterized protein n=1 Tax=Marinospirillum celere TaxID=1122252 RepID=A0A1I1FGM8_9GAMM|nr:hypothetical protein [Marinospirillum celere]SFB98649.1 hypothetical protein SAMN05660443_1007 [Marinospirillum celere]